MKNVIRSFKTITDELREKLELTINDYEFTYYKEIDDEIIEKEIFVESDGDTQSNSNRLMLSTKDSDFDSERHGFNIYGSLNVDNPKALFGKDGIANESSTIGVAISWRSKQSKQRNVSKVAKIISKDQHTAIDFFYEFEKQTLRDELVFEVILYLENFADEGKNMSYHAKRVGTIFGVLDSFVIALDGTGSLFPIVVAPSNNDPLWCLDMHFNDPRTDSFSAENICIRINSNHENYELLDMDKGGMYTSVLLREIVANAIAMIIFHLKSDSEIWESILTDDFEESSICNFVRYCINTHHWKYDGIAELSRSVRKKFDSISGGKNDLGRIEH